MANEAVMPADVVAPLKIAPEPQPVSFMEIVARITSGRIDGDDVRISESGSYSSGGISIRSSLERLNTSERSIAERSSRIGAPSPSIPRLTEGNGLPEAFGKDGAVKGLEQATATVNNMVDVMSYIVQMNIINKSVQGFQRVLDQLGRGQ